MAERGMLGLFAGARGDRRRHLASAALASALAFALASALAAILTATSALTRVGLPARAALQPLAGVWLPPGRGTQNAGALCTRCAPAHRAERSRVFKHRKGKVAFRRVRCVRT